MVNDNRKASIFAYYLSKFDRDALIALGFNSFTEAFSVLSKMAGKDNNYIKLRRDEFDPLTGSHRLGWHKREPSPSVVALHNGLKNYTFEQFTEIVKLIMYDKTEQIPSILDVEAVKPIIKDYSEEELELIINGKDATASLIRHPAIISSRIFDRNIPMQLKKLYEYRCQICGASAFECYHVDITEAHHIELFSKTANNNSNNIMVVCPDHHRIIHKAHPIFNKDLLQFEYENGRIDNLMYNIHL